MAFTAVYDADVLHPPSVRDLLLRLAVTGLFQARWSEQILDEMVDSIIRQRPELAARLARTRALMCDAVQDCVVAGYEDLIDGLVLPDPDDRHVLAAAIRCSAQVIVTNNIRDFPADTLAPYGIQAQTADEFVVNLCELAPAAVRTVVETQAAALRRPPQSTDELLSRLQDRGLLQSVAFLRQLLRR